MMEKTSTEFLSVSLSTLSLSLTLLCVCVCAAGWRGSCFHLPRRQPWPTLASRGSSRTPRGARCTTRNSSTSSTATPSSNITITITIRIRIRMRIRIRIRKEASWRRKTPSSSQTPWCEMKAVFKRPIWILLFIFLFHYTVLGFFRVLSGRSFLQTKVLLFCLVAQNCSSLARLSQAPCSLGRSPRQSWIALASQCSWREAGSAAKASRHLSA
mmetsp:Transcript_2800/g.7353  ORF Transcript_2800/g.7353 Transcript_2800/m.7353 type:complete len:213 (+) Transcript_2800:147-785(+)